MHDGIMREVPFYELDGTLLRIFDYLLGNMFLVLGAWIPDRGGVLSYTFSFFWGGGTGKRSDTCGDLVVNDSVFDLEWIFLFCWIFLFLFLL